MTDERREELAEKIIAKETLIAKLTDQRDDLEARLEDLAEEIEYMEDELWGD